jgi:mono/diheme cytochrome c family protein
MNMGTSKATIALIGFAAISLFACRVGAAEKVDPGKNLYRQYCGACHGSEGKGDGVVSGLMTPRPTDLTQIAQKNQGQFPFYRMFRVIDGRESVRAHGDPDMPVWGGLFARDAGGSMERETIVRGKLMLITEYLESIQQIRETK